MDVEARAAGHLERAVHHYAVEPGREGPGGVELRDPLVDRHERIRRHVFGGLGVAGDGVGGARGGQAVEARERLKPGYVAAFQARYGVALLLLHPLCVAPTLLCIVTPATILSLIRGKGWVFPGNSKEAHGFNHRLPRSTRL